MDDKLESLVVRVRADTGAFARDVEAMRGQLEGPLAHGVERAGRAMEGALARFVSSGKLGFDDLKRLALQAFAEIAAASTRQAGGSGPEGGLLSAVLGTLGLPGRATGGPVTGGRPYLVGERGPELFVPTTAGRVEPLAHGGRGVVNVTVNVAAPREAGGAFMARTGTQVARAVRAALERVGD